MPRNGGWPGTAPISLTSGLSISATICLPASRSLPPSKMPAATSSSPASQLRIRRLLNTCRAPNCKNIVRPSANPASAPPPPTAGSTPCRCAPRTDAILVNWFSIETFNAKGKRTYYNSFVTDLAITRDTVAELAACGRARWKIENETFNVLKTNGYNLEHNFGHGKKTLASILVTLNLLAFAFHTAAYLGVLAWRAAIIARGPMYRFFEHLRTVTAYVVFQDWPHLLQSIAAAAIRPP